MTCTGDWTTHHNACDCREAARAEEIAALRAIAEHGTHTEQTRLLADALGLREGAWTVDGVARVARERLAAFEACNRARAAAEAERDSLQVQLCLATDALRRIGEEYHWQDSPAGVLARKVVAAALAALDGGES